VTRTSTVLTRWWGSRCYQHAPLLPGSGTAPRWWTCRSRPCTAKMKCAQIVTHGGRGQTARTHGTSAAAVANTTTTTRTRHSPIDAVHELEQEALVVLVSDAHEALQQCQSLARAEAEYALIFLGIRCSLTGRCTTCSPSAWASVCPGALTLKFFYSKWEYPILKFWIRH
jgi:hypothetical protein